MTIPSRFWITKGIGESDVSELSAFDESLMSAGIGYQNHVLVSSVPPSIEIQPKIVAQHGLTYIQVGSEWKLIPSSAILYVVRAIKSGKKGDSVATCISLAKVTIITGDETLECVLAYEANGSNPEVVNRTALSGLKEMVERRQAILDENWGNSGYKIVSSSLEITKEYGCSVSFVVMDPFTFKHETYSS
ncbi:MAG: pyruvoyl-dependent arginine decarboxylase [Candidatus Heimdallarchaeaceae archaeon]